MRTLEKFTATYSQAEWFVYFHKKPVWLIALDDDYVLSVIAPQPEEVTFGTLAVLYGVDMEGGLKVLEQVASTKRIFDCVTN